MNECSKAVKRRFNDPAFHLHFYRGHGIDIGGGDDPLGRYVGHFARMESCRTWDLADGDAQELEGVADNSFDFVASSHCLEHLRDPSDALFAWSQVVKPGGYLIVTVPDFDLYEAGKWPSHFNADHKWKFTLSRKHDPDNELLNVVNWLGGLVIGCSVERLQLVRDFYSPALAGTDQTLLPNAESAIEFVLRKNG